ncbi:hypothetical protein [Marinicellulosiphila megalodicopiae]|uniref:hypothetical protein n=1 Tax=Marinicellulosiphila megalodicopiae TaxID=2724896 RepID=UPI003BAF29F1
MFNFFKAKDTKINNEWASVWSCNEIPEELMDALEGARFQQMEDLRDKNNINYIEAIHKLYFSTKDKNMKACIATVVVDIRRSHFALEILLDSAKNGETLDEREFSLMGVADDRDISYAESKKALKKIDKYVTKNGVIAYSNKLYSEKGARPLYDKTHQHFLDEIEKKDCDAAFDLARAYKNGTFVYENEGQYKKYLQLAKDFGHDLVGL